MFEKRLRFIGTIIVMAIYVYLFGALLVSCFHNMNIPKPSQPSQWLTPTPSTPTPTFQPTPTPIPTSEPTPTPTLHPDLKDHYTTREDIIGYENMSEQQIQNWLDIYDYGYEVGYDLGRVDGREYGYDDGYKDGYDNGYDDAEDEFNQSPDYEPSYDHDDWIMGL